MISGFAKGFKLGFKGPRLSSSCNNLKSCLDFPNIVTDKLQAEITANRLKGPFLSRPFPTLQMSPIGLVPKKSQRDFRLIHHLSHPEGKSVNDFIDPSMKTVKYASFDDAVNLLQCGQGSYFAKTDIKNAFRLIPIHPTDYDLLGIQFQGEYYYDTY